MQTRAGAKLWPLPAVFTLTALTLLGWAWRPSASRAQDACLGDCDGNGRVAINEVIAGVNIGLGALSLEQCTAFDGDRDGAVAINEVVRAVGFGLDGCPAIDPVTARAVVERYGDILYTKYSEAEARARDLLATIQDLVANPSAARLEAAREAWKAGRPAYLQTEIARFYGGPIDNEENGPEGFVNAWPLDESYIDYVQGNPDAGIVNDPVSFPEITRDLLLGLNEAGGETTISTGWHAIEFLLWGQDFDPQGPGSRTYTDYVTDGSGTARNQERRGRYLLVCGELLVEHLAQVRAEWAPGRSDNYRAEIESVDTDEALRRILTGIATLNGGELTGERLAVPYETKDQEDEHSCFSDNTHVDHRNDAIGVRDVFLGRLGGVDGAGVGDLVRAVDPDLADRTIAAIDAAIAAVFEIPVPFDQAILGTDSQPARRAIAAALAALNAETDLFGESAAALGISISTTP